VTSVAFDLSRLESVPRIPLVTLPTPLERLAGISRRLGREVLVKRDDLTGLGFGGNKARKLEYLMAEAVAAQADLVITGGGDQSNHARMTAAACTQLGIGCELHLCAVPGAAVAGNLFLDELFGANVVIHESESRLEPCLLERLETFMQEAVDAACRRGQRPYLIPPGGAVVAGAIGYVVAMRELADQLAAMGITADYVVTATGAGGTQAGIEVGLRLFHPMAQAIGIAIGDTAEGRAGAVADLANATAEFLGLSSSLTPKDIRVDDYIGESYAIPSPEGVAAIAELARSDALVLDPVYTGKAMAGLLDLARRGEIGPDARVVFLHTGGSPALFAQTNPVLSAIRSRTPVSY
jgi:D-cysteine desulfhydrase family pyridoxal phosphate-dependent enzyme